MQPSSEQSVGSCWNSIISFCSRLMMHNWLINLQHRETLAAKHEHYWPSRLENIFAHSIFPPWRIGSIRPLCCSWIEGKFLPSIQHLQLDRRQLFTFYSAFAAGYKANFPLAFSLHSWEISSEILKKSVSSSVPNQFTIKVSQIKDIL